MNNLICDSMDHWLASRRIVPPGWSNSDEPIKRQLDNAFHAQHAIGWDQFFRGRIAKAWSIPIQTYYCARRPGETFTPDRWMRTMINEVWKFSLTLWKQRNTELHGTDGALTLERRRKEAVTRATNIFNETLGNVSPTDSIVLHDKSIDKIMHWTQTTLNAYIASADAILEQEEDAG